MALRRGHERAVVSGIPRFLRRVATVALPEAIKCRLRGRLYGYRPPRSTLRVVVHAASDVTVVTMDDTLILRVPTVMMPDLQFHLVENGESIDELSALLNLARDPGGLLFDVGGHVSLFAHLFCLASPQNRAVSYEPAPRLRGLAQDLRAQNGLEDRLTLNPSAIGDHTASVAGHVDPNGFMAFGDPPSPAEVIPVAFTTIDAECERLGVSPDVVKIDIEGFEDRALAGAQRLLRERRPILLLELHLDLLEQRGVSSRILVEGLTRNGYVFYGTDGRSMAPRHLYGSASAVIHCVARPEWT